MSDIPTIHNNLITSITIEYLDDSINNGLPHKMFRLNARKYLDTPLQQNTRDVTEIMDRLSAKGLLRPGQYDVLRELVSNIHSELLEMIDKAQREIDKLKVKTDEQNIAKTFQNRERDRSTKEDAESMLRYKRVRRSSSDEYGDGDRKKKVLKCTEGAEDFRKVEDNSLQSDELHRFYTEDWHNSVAYVNLEGTAFRVGSQYLMSAFHVWKNKIDSIWKIVRDVVQNDPQQTEWIKIWQELNVPITLSENERPSDVIKKVIASWRKKVSPAIEFTEFLNSLDRAGFRTSAEDLRRILTEEWTAKCKVYFGKLTREMKESYHVQYDIPFFDEENDVIILKLSETSLPFPKSFHLLEDEDSFSNEMHIIGNPDSHEKIQIFDPRCPVIVTDVDKQQAGRDVESAKAFWNNLGLTDLAQNYDILYESMRTQLIFHCSLSTAHGASGSPGIIHFHSKRPIVQAMLQSGVPQGFYSCGPAIKSKLISMINKNEIPLNYLFERGISMPTVCRLLHDSGLHDLRYDLFHS